MITVLSEADLAAIALPDETIREAVEAGLVAQAKGRAIAEPTSMFNPVPERDDLIAVIRGALPDQKLALVKTVGGFPGNAEKGLATNPGCLTLIETETGQITGLLPAARITTERTAMVTAIGASRLARSGAGVVGCIGTGGIAVQAVRYIAQTMALDEIRLHGRYADRTVQAAEALAEETGIRVRPVSDWESCFIGADILIDGAALPRDIALFPTAALTTGAILIVFGAFSSLPLDIMANVDRLIMDRWVSDGRGALGPIMTAGAVDERAVHAMIGDVIAGRSKGRSFAEERVLYCHRGVAACDLTLASAYLEEAQKSGLGIRIEL